MKKKAQLAVSVSCDYHEQKSKGEPGAFCFFPLSYTDRIPPAQKALY